MAIYTVDIAVPELSADDKATIAAKRVVANMRASIDGIDDRLSQVRQALVFGGGKAAVAAKLGADAAELQQAYNALKSVVTTYAAREVDAL